MPELPEVETIRRDLIANVVGRRFTNAVVTGRRTVRRQSANEVVDRLSSAVVVGVDRVGKYLVLRLDSDDRLVIHLRMSGQLRLHTIGESMAPHTHAVVTLEDDHELRFVDPRTFGEWFIGTDDELRRLAPSLSSMGIDPLSDDFQVTDLAASLRSRRIALKAFMMRGDLLAGIGNIYSDEILFEARLRFDRRTHELTGPEMRRLRTAVSTVLRAAVAARGSSLSDAQYVDLFGRPGGFQAQHQVYARCGEPCLRCGRAVERTAFQQRSTFFCGRCQR